MPRKISKHTYFLQHVTLSLKRRKQVFVNILKASKYYNNTLQILRVVYL